MPRARHSAAASTGLQLRQGQGASCHERRAGADRQPFFFIAEPDATYEVVCPFQKCAANAAPQRAVRAMN